MWKTICLLTISALLLTSCSGNEADPVTPLIEPTELSADVSAGSNHILWGAWNLTFDIDGLSVTIEPIRNAQPHFNITQMVQPPNCDDCLAIQVLSFDPLTRIMSVNVTLTNQFSIPGRDVRGILFTNEAGHMLTNADEWTDLYDPPGGMDHNPFKAFAKTELNRVFGGTAEHSENYLVYIPIPPSYISIAYAVDASWPGNCREPYLIDNFIQDPIYDAAGSSGGVWVDVYDWQDDVEAVEISAYALDGNGWMPMETGTGDKWVAIISNDQHVPVGEYDVWIKATSEGSGVVDIYDHFTITVTELPPRNRLVPHMGMGHGG